MKKTLLIGLLGLPLVLGGCAQLMQAQMYGAKGAARAVVAECTLSPMTRQSNLDAINSALSDLGSVAQASALDCDGDGNPDL